VDGFAGLAAPLVAALTAKGTAVAKAWTNEHTASFEAIKRAIITSSELVMPDFSKEFVVRSDASNAAIAAVLGQYDDLGRLRPVWQWSRGLTPAERKWNTTEKETQGEPRVRGVHQNGLRSGAAK
jgi:hypothetical protein